jgi:hypothetical protein
VFVTGPLVYLELFTRAVQWRTDLLTASERAMLASKHCSAVLFQTRLGSSPTSTSLYLRKLLCSLC